MFYFSESFVLSKVIPASKVPPVDGSFRKFRGKELMVYLDC